MSENGRLIALTVFAVMVTVLIISLCVSVHADSQENCRQMCGARGVHQFTESTVNFRAVCECAGAP